MKQIFVQKQDLQSGGNIMAGKILSFEIDENDAVSFNNICEQIGVPMESLLRIFVKQVIRTNSVPFALSLDVRNENQKISADLAEILEANASSLAEILKDENSHIVTFIISKMNYDDAARLLELLPQKMQEEIMLLLVNGMSMNAELFAAYVRYIKQKLEHSAAENYAFGSYEVSPETMLEKLNYPTKKRLLLALKNNDIKNYERISKNVFTFNDISRLTDRCVQKILREIDAMVLARALKGCETEVR